MDNKQALQLIKQALDEAVSQGAYKNLEFINAIITAFNQLSQELDKKDIKK